VTHRGGPGLLAPASVIRRAVDCLCLPVAIPALSFITGTSQLPVRARCYWDYLVYIRSGGNGPVGLPGSKARGSGLSGLGLVRGRVAALAAVIALLLIGGTWVALTKASAQPKTGKDAAAGHAAQNPAARHAGPASSAPVRVLSVTPASHERQVDGASPIRVTFSGPLAADSPLPTLTPSIAGSWRASGRTLEFVPALGYQPLTHVKLVIPGGPSGVRSAGGGLLATRVVDKFVTGTYGTLRLEQLLAQLGYLPLNWEPIPGDLPVPAADANAQLSAAYDPPQGTFLWQPGYPSVLQSMWQPARPDNNILIGAVRALESDQNLPMDGVAGPAVWKALFSAVARGQDNSHGYTYAYASEGSPETLTIWHDGRQIMHTLANTGIPVRPTVTGTYPVYLRYRFQIMRGINPDGSHYADPVSFVAYFNGGDAVHYFPRYSYGWPQSLGCVELPYAQAEHAWPFLTYGTLVTVAP
jgi:peptidoglycan hydrolase-like protein with peptidoglycan-binding domain